MPIKETRNDLLAMSSGSLLLAVGVYFFKIPNGFTTGGVSGIATVAAHLFPVLSPATVIVVLNALLLLVGFLTLGRQNLFRTLFCSGIYSAAVFLLERAFPLSAPLTHQPFLELIYGILLTGVGAALLFRANATSGGTDIIALILRKYTSLDVGAALLFADFLIAFSTLFVFGLTTGLFSLLGLFIKAFLIDSVIENMNLCKSFLIVTDKEAPIIDYILHGMRRSATVIDARGAYTDERRKVIFTLCRRGQAARFKRRLREIDPAAFVIVQSTSEIIGNGF